MGCVPCNSSHIFFLQNISEVLLLYFTHVSNSAVYCLSEYNTTLKGKESGDSFDKKERVCDNSSFCSSFQYHHYYCCLIFALLFHSTRRHRFERGVVALKCAFPFERRIGLDRLPQLIANEGVETRPRRQRAAVGDVEALVEEVKPQRAKRGASAVKKIIG